MESYQLSPIISVFLHYFVTMDGVIVIQYLIVRQPNNFLLCGFHSKNILIIQFYRNGTKSDFLLQC